MTVALVTNSALVVNWTGIDKYIQEPLEKSFQTKTIDLNDELNYLNPNKETYEFPYLTSVSYKQHKDILNLWKWSNIEVEKRRLV